jgi:fibronectin type 3 domain-containing protein
VYPSDPFDTRVMVVRPNGMPVAATVLAYHSNVAGTLSAQPVATPSALLPPAPPVTQAPGNEAMAVEWTDVSGATSYRVYRRAPGAEWKLRVTVTASAFTDTDVQNGERYTYAVQPVNASGPGSWGFTNIISTASASIPRAPDDVQVQPGNGALQVDWAPVAGATQYNLYTGSSQLGPFTYVGSTGDRLENRGQVPATNGVATWVVVSAYGAGVNGVASAEVSGIASAALPGQPSGSATATMTPGSVLLTWSPVSGAIDYRIHRRPANGGVTVLTTTATTTHTDTGLTTGGAYVYYVEARNAAGYGVWSVPLPVTAP